MVFKNFNWQISLRLLILTGVLLTFCYCIVAELYLRAFYVGVVAALSVVELFYFLTNFIRNIRTFLIAIQQHDFNIHFQENRDSLRELYRELNKVTGSFKKLGEEKEVQHRFLEMLVEHIRIGIICFDDQGEVRLANNAFRKLVYQKQNMKFTLDRLEPSLVHELMNMQPGETKTIKYASSSSAKVLALYSSDFRLKEVGYKLISLQDITHEMDSREVEAWMKLMRVLTHEIMNSMSPIVSLSDTLYTMAQAQLQKSQSEVMHSLRDGLDAIRVRSRGLQQFSDSYRQLSRLPAPNFQETTSGELLRKVTSLFSDEFRTNQIKLITEILDSKIMIDSNLLEQALINLFKNSIDALHGCENAMIALKAAPSNSKFQLQISDNGPGIHELDLDKIFVPFFSTKKDGTGIGLAIVRQIVHLHRGEIYVESIPNERTTFTILL